MPLSCPRTVPLRSSIRRRAYATYGLLLGIALASALANLYVVRNYFADHREEELQVTATDKAHHVSQYLGFYEQQITSLAAIPEVHDMAVFGDRDAAQAWALQARRFLPRTVGLAIASAEGLVLGEPPALRLGPQCVADLSRLQQSQALPRPPVHTDIPDLAHFDLTAPVRDDSGAVVGILFVSFKLNVLQEILSQAADAGQYLELHDAHGHTLASAGTPPLDSASDMRGHNVPVAGSQWTLHLKQVMKPPATIYMVLVFSVLLMWLAVTILVVYSVASITSLFSGELEGVRKMLSRVQQGDFDTTSVPFQLEETVPVIAAIAGLARDIQESQQRLAGMSQTDELTGLTNRRHFNEEYLRDLDFAQRGIPVCLALIDLDGFKGLNDSAGHAAGDQMLRLLGQSLKHTARKTDCTARLGGDEFAVLLVQMDVENAHVWLERLRRDFDTRQANDPLLSWHPRCTFSSGFVRIDPKRDRILDDATCRADEALYQAKRDGKARTVAA